MELFSRFPTIGRKTAARFVFYLIALPEKEIKELLEAIKDIQDKVQICRLCHRSFESAQGGDKDICPICANPQRDRSVISLVEKEVDLESIEETRKFKGLYFILDGVFRDKAKEDEKINQRIEELVKRVKEDEDIKEIILALNPTLEGRNTSLLIERRLKKAIPEERQLKTTHLACGLPKGGELEYADEETISSALEHRQ